MLQFSMCFAKSAYYSGKKKQKNTFFTCTILCNFKFGVPTFYFTKNVQNEHFYIKVFERKIHTFQTQIWVPTLYSTKNVQNEHFYIKVFEKKCHIFQFQFSVPTFYFTKNVQNEHFYIKVFEKKFHTFQIQIWSPPSISPKMFKMNTFT